MSDLTFTKAELSVIHRALISYCFSMKGKLQLAVEKRWTNTAVETQDQIKRAELLRTKLAGAC